MKVLQALVNSSSLCDEGVWSAGNALLNVCFSLMRAHCTNGISRGRCEVLEVDYFSPSYMYVKYILHFYEFFLYHASDLSDLLLTISTSYQDIGKCSCCTFL